MDKILITEPQYTKLRSFLLEMSFRTYVFDWDDNILYMSTKILMDKKDGDKWVPVNVTTSEYSNIRLDINYKLRDDNPMVAFLGFNDNEAFIRDVKEAIHHEKFAPSFDKFKEALINSNPFAINTARGHSPDTIKEGVKIFIEMVLTDKEKSKMVKNIRKTINLTKGLDDNQSIDLYLDDMGEYYPVSSKEFGKKFGVEVHGSAASPEEAKKVAIEHFINKVFDNMDNLINSGYKKMSVGFSDDDVGNIRAVEEFIEEELNKLYPELHFVIYDTSAGGKRKMVIEKE